MPSGFLVRLRPSTPWRIGPGSGARDRVETIYHSDSLYSAATAAMLQLGMLDDWLRATAENPAGSDVRFSSCYPFQRRTLFVVPPQNVWPPPLSTKLRYKGARFVPVQLVASLLADQPVDETRWLIDGPSECLLPSDRNEGPFRIAIRSNAALDRLNTGVSEAHSTACMEFASGSGLWFLTGFASAEARRLWADPVKAALRLLCDSGFGGERSRGWGRAEMPEFIEGDLTRFVIPSRPTRATQAAATEAEEEQEAPAEATPVDQESAAEAVFAAVIESPAEAELGAPEAAQVPDEPVAQVSGLPAEPDLPSEPEPPEAQHPSAEAAPSPPEPAGPHEQSWWLLSLFTPDAQDGVDWEKGKYAIVTRSGRIESPVRHGEMKPPAYMVQEGSVIVCGAEPRGRARNVAPEGFPHAVYRAGFAVAIPLPPRVTS